jgi:hypothetical protein
MLWEESWVDHIFDILVVLAPFDEQDLEIWICCRESAGDDTAGTTSFEKSVGT